MANAWGLTRAGAVALSLVLNASLLALLSFQEQRRLPRVIDAPSPVYVDIEPVFRVRGDSPILPPTKSQSNGPIKQEGAQRRLALPRATSVPSASEDPVAVQTPAYDSQWTVRTDGRRANAGSGARTARVGPPNCAWDETLSLLERDRCRNRVAAANTQAPLPRSGDEDRTSAFARAAETKKRWKDYRENDGAYPGLRSLFGGN